MYQLLDDSGTWTAMAAHADYDIGIGQITWMSHSGRCVIIRHNVAEDGYYTTCDWCSVQMLTAEKYNFSDELDAIAAFIERGWRIGEDESIICPDCRQITRTPHELNITDNV